MSFTSEQFGFYRKSLLVAVDIAEDNIREFYAYRWRQQSAGNLTSIINHRCISSSV